MNEITFYSPFHFSFLVMHQALTVKLFDRRVCHLGYNRIPLPLNFAKFEIPVRRFPWLTTRSFRTLSHKALFERSSAHLKLLLLKTRSFHFIGGLGHRSIYGSNLRRFRYWQIPK